MHGIDFANTIFCDKMGLKKETLMRKVLVNDLKRLGIFGTERKELIKDLKSNKSMYNFEAPIFNQNIMRFRFKEIGQKEFLQLQKPIIKKSAKTIWSF